MIDIRIVWFCASLILIAMLCLRPRAFLSQSWAQILKRIDIRNEWLLKYINLREAQSMVVNANEYRIFPRILRHNYYFRNSSVW